MTDDTTTGAPALDDVDPNPDLLVGDEVTADHDLDLDDFPADTPGDDPDPNPLTDAEIDDLTRETR